MGGSPCYELGQLKKQILSLRGFERFCSHGLFPPPSLSPDAGVLREGGTVSEVPVHPQVSAPIPRLGIRKLTETSHFPLQEEQVTEG